MGVGVDGLGRWVAFKIIYKLGRVVYGVVVKMATLRTCLCPFFSFKNCTLHLISYLCGLKKYNCVLCNFEIPFLMCS